MIRYKHSSGEVPGCTKYTVYLIWFEQVITTSINACSKQHAIQLVAAELGSYDPIICADLV